MLVKNLSIGIKNKNRFYVFLFANIKKVWLLLEKIQMMKLK